MGKVWQVDFDRRPLQDTEGHPLWELVVYDPQTQMACQQWCPEPDVSSLWLAAQLQEFFMLMAPKPTHLQVFRPRTLSILQEISERFGIILETQRRTMGLKQVLQMRSQHYLQMPEYTGQAYDPLWIEQLPPQPLPEELWGEQWQFVTLTARALESELLQRPIPLQGIPSQLLPSQLGLASATPIPGVLINGGRRSMQLAQWIQQHQPITLTARRAELSGLILAAGLNERYVLVTYDDPEMVLAEQKFEQDQQHSQGLHFLLIQPDDSGVTYSGLWLLSTAGV
jgi:hypothetical protein